MKLNKFKFPREVFDEIEKLQSAYQGMVSAALLFWIFNDDTAFEATLPEEVRSDYQRIKAMLNRRVTCSRKACRRSLERKAAGKQQNSASQNKARHPQSSNTVDAPVFANYINMSRIMPVEVKGPYSHCPPFNYYTVDGEGTVYFFLLVGIGQRTGDVIGYNNLMRPLPGQCDVGLATFHGLDRGF